MTKTYLNIQPLDDMDHFRMLEKGNFIYHFIINFFLINDFATQLGLNASEYHFHIQNTISSLLTFQVMGLLSDFLHILINGLPCNQNCHIFNAFQYLILLIFVCSIAISLLVRTIFFCAFFLASMKITFEFVNHQCSFC